MAAPAGNLWLIQTAAAAGGWALWNILGKVSSAKMGLPAAMVVLFSKLAEAGFIVSSIATTTETAIVGGASVGIYTMANIKNVLSSNSLAIAVAVMSGVSNIWVRDL